MRKDKIKIFSGSANHSLAREIAAHVGIALGEAEVSRFSDGEIQIGIKESVRGKNVFLIQPLCDPINEHIMELLILIDALKRASAHSVNAVVPYYGYARQDRKTRARDPITAKLLADLITAAGASRVIAMDLHAGQIQGFFNIPFDHLTAVPIIANYLKDKQIKGWGSLYRRSWWNGLRTGQPPGAAYRCHRQEKARPNQAEVMNIIGDGQRWRSSTILSIPPTVVLGAEALKENTQGLRLLQPPGLFRAGPGAASGRRCRRGDLHQFDPRGSKPAGGKISCSFRGAADRRGDHADQRRSFGERAFRLN